MMKARSILKFGTCFALAGMAMFTADAALAQSVVRIGMTFLGVNIFAQNIVFGAVLVAAIAITIDRSKIPIVK